MKKFCFLLTIAIYIFGCQVHKNNLSIGQKNAQVIKDINDTIIVNPPHISTPTSGPRDPFSNSNYVTVRTFFATDRNPVIAGIGTSFGINRSNVHYGICSVSIPRTHKVGVVESPSIFNLELNEDAQKHITILKIDEESKNTYFSQIKEKLSNSSKNAIVFIHGYNVSFPSAAKLTAQICYDLDFKGVPVFYSWPSQGNLLAYTIDETNSEWSIQNFKSFLKDFLLLSGAENIYLIAHSMGNRLLMRAISDLVREDNNLKQRFREIILTAPDVDTDIFKRDLAPSLINSGRRVTLYASSTDQALLYSKKIHGYQRVGDVGKNIVITPNIETVDATNVNTDFFGHSYFASSRSVLDDIFYLINNDLGAEKRNLLKTRNKLGVYWTFKE